MFGNPSEATLDVRPALGGRFLELELSRRAVRRPRLLQLRLRRALAGDLVRQSRRHLPDRGAGETERTLTSEWGSADTERGRTVYRLADDGRLRVTDSRPPPDGAYREFARTRLHARPNSPRRRLPLARAEG